MKVCWLRHGEKQNASGSDRANPGLTPAGLKQASRLANLVKSKKLPAPALLYASQTQRTHQTLQSLATQFSLNIQTQELLNQRFSTESAKEFHQRVLRALRWVEELAQPNPKNVALYLCSHIDWLNEAYSNLSSSENLPFLEVWQPGEYMVFEIENGLWNQVDRGIL
jgi:broad specificity phosphatase PhoE